MRKLLGKIRCCYVGCKRESESYLDFDKPALDDGDFNGFSICACNGRAYSNDRNECPWQCEMNCSCKDVFSFCKGEEAYLAAHKILFTGRLCPEHWESFGGKDQDERLMNIANSDPELFDKREWAEFQRKLYERRTKKLA